MNEKLKTTLQKIKVLSEQNPEFAHELRKMIIGSSSATTVSCDNKKIDKIERYLGLDYNLDSHSPEIDYSKIADSNVRNQLISDYREMLRYRYGVRSHKIDFGEFCKYAHFQAEMLVNYFYISKYGDSAVSVLAGKNNYIKPGCKLEEVPYTNKLFVFKTEYKYKSNVLDNVAKARNSINHRTTNIVFDLKTRHCDYLKMLADSNLPLNQEGDDFNWPEITSKTVLKNIYETKHKNASPFKERAKAYKYDKWRATEQFDEVVKAIVEFYGIIITNLQQ